MEVGERDGSKSGYQMEGAMTSNAGHERRHLRVQAGHPAEDVGFTAQLLQALHLRMISTEIVQKLADRPAVRSSRTRVDLTIRFDKTAWLQ